MEVERRNAAGRQNLNAVMHRILEKTNLWAAMNVHHTEGTYAPYLHTITTMRTGLYHQLFFHEEHVIRLNQRSAEEAAHVRTPQRNPNCRYRTPKL